MEENNNEEQKTGYAFQEDYMEKIRATRQIFRNGIKQIMEEETGETYKEDENLLVVFNKLSEDQQQTITGRINLLQKFSSSE